MELTPRFHHLFFITIIVACSATAQEVDNEKEFSYDEHSKKGPAHWGEIRPEWRNCISGEMQSPIDLVDQKVRVVAYLGALLTTYKPSYATLKNRGHDMMLRWAGGAGNVMIDETIYQLKQLHWHSPSEHAIDGVRFDLELHLVHQSNDKSIAVIGILYRIGRPDSFLSTLRRDLEAVAETRDVEKVVGVVDLRPVIIGTKQYYRYIGSLTTPPCTSNVTWTILRKVRAVSTEQVQLIRDAIHDDSKANARPLQPLHGRTVELNL